MLGASGLIAIILPPGEGFSDTETGAVGTVVRDHARLANGAAVVLGPPQPGATFAGLRYQPVAGTSMGWGGATRYRHKLVQALRQLRPALIEVHNRPELAAALARAIPQTAVVLYLHNDPQRMRGFPPPPRVAIAAVSAHLARRCAPRTAEVLANPIDFAEIPLSPPSDARERLVLFAGRVVADKGPDLFVRAFAQAAPRMPGWRAAILGADRFSAASPETPFWRAVAREANAAGIQMLGYRPRRAVLAALSTAAVAVVPSRWAEPFGLAALEAMACGAALIASDRGGLPDVIGEAAWRIDPDDTAAFAAALVTLATDPARRARLAQAGRAQAAGFALEAVGPRLSALRTRLAPDWSAPDWSAPGGRPI